MTRHKFLLFGVFRVSLIDKKRVDYYDKKGSI